MKKILAITLALMMLAMALVACDTQEPSNENTTDAEATTEAKTEAGTSAETEAGTSAETEADSSTTTEETTTAAPAELAYKSAEELLKLLMDAYNANATEDTMLYVCGGNPYNFETTNPEGPAKFVALEDGDYDANLGYPTADISKQDDAASMFNMMNINVFNCYAVHFTNSADVDAMATAIKDNILARQWICGAPEKLVIAKMPGDYLVVVWGAVEFGGVVDPFTASFATTVEGSSIVVEHTFAQ
ncbi:MAG: hypothetical protein IKB28_01950 [Clostridia bacterium]|nr:hypothetical protein [Clostridia bacterium]